MATARPQNQNRRLNRRPRLLLSRPTNFPARTLRSTFSPSSSRPSTPKARSPPETAPRRIRHRPGEGHPESIEARRPLAQRHGGHRTQRSLRRAIARGHPASRPRCHSRQSQWRRRRPWPPARLHGRKTYRHHYSRTPTPQRALRHGDHVHRRGHGRCRNLRAPLMTGNPAHGLLPDPIRNPSFRAKQADALSSLPLPRKVGLRREKSLLDSIGSFADFLLRRLRLNLLLCSAVLVLAIGLNAQAPIAVPIPKEPHHHLVFENSYVRVFRVSVPAHEATLLHQHDVPYLYVALGPADVINAVQGKPEVRLVMADEQVGYSPGHL